MGSIPAAALSFGPMGATGLTSMAGRNLKNQSPKDLAKVCREVESVFLAQLMKQMRSSMISSINPRSQWDKGYVALCEQHVAQAMSAGGGIGLAQRLYEQLSMPRVKHPGKEIINGSPQEAAPSRTPD